jgi:hypothetical protein
VLTASVARRVCQLRAADDGAAATYERLRARWAEGGADSLGRKLDELEAILRSDGVSLTDLVSEQVRVIVKRSSSRRSSAARAAPAATWRRRSRARGCCATR